jgi:hypothetical protein
MARSIRMMLLHQAMHGFQAGDACLCTALVQDPRQLACRVVIIATIMMALPVSAGPETARAAGDQSQRTAAGWLRLEQDQRETRQRLAPMTPTEAARQQSLDRQDAIRFRETLQRQDREIQSLRRQERQTRQMGGVGALESPGSQSRIQGRLMQQQQELEAQRLRMRTERRGQP